MNFNWTWLYLGNLLLVSRERRTNWMVRAHFKPSLWPFIFKTKAFEAIVDEKIFKRTLHLNISVETL